MGPVLRVVVVPRGGEQVLLAMAGELVFSVEAGGLVLPADAGGLALWCIAECKLELADGLHAIHGMKLAGSLCSSET